MTNKKVEVKIKVKIPTQANGAPRNFIYTNKTRARAPAPLKTADPLARNQKRPQIELKNPPLKPKEGLNGAPVDQP